MTAADRGFPRKAAQYVRMSTEHQQYSTANQKDVIQDFAAAHGYTIIRTYADEGKSGLNIKGRNALKQLIADVENGYAEFDAVLVYDVSRWGRFQDPDLSAYYEQVCKLAGIEIIYCAEQFTNDGGPAAIFVKQAKRMMAAEYSRELSDKVFKGQCRLITEGFRQGGPPGFGLRRMLMDRNGHPKGILDPREYKSLQTDRVILVPGPPEETDTVREIYHLFIDRGKSERQIAQDLNTRGILRDRGRRWTRGSVRQILSNEKYIGNNVYNRSSFKLKQKRVNNPEELWVRCDRAFEALVDPGRFRQAQGIIAKRSCHVSDQEMLDRLKTLLNKHGRLSGLLIDESSGTPSSAAYRMRFKGLLRAYRLIGYTPERDYGYLEVNRYLRRLYPKTVKETVSRIEALKGTVTYEEQTDLLFINDELTVSLILSRCRQTQAGALRWLVRFDTGLEPDLTIAVRMDALNQGPMDYYILPFADISEHIVRLAENNRIDLDAYRFENLDFFFGMTEQVGIGEMS